MVSGAFAVGMIVLVAAIVAVLTVKSLIVIVPPNRAAVITGKNRQLGDGEVVGYRSVIGGRTLRIPIIETVQHVTLETIPLEISVANAFSKGNIPLNIEAIANVKIASEPETTFNNAVERLLGKTEGEISSMARDTLMGNLRGVLATLTPEEDRLGFAKALGEDAGEDLAALGFHLDVLKIQNVSDERGYLEAIGRKKAAEAIREAEIAEADAEADTRERQAQARQRGRGDGSLRQHLDRGGPERATGASGPSGSGRRDRGADCRRESAGSRGRGTAGPRGAAGRQGARAAARRRGGAGECREGSRSSAGGGGSRSILDRGKAQVEILRRLYEQILSGGDQAFAVFMAEKLPELLGTAVDAVKGVDIDRLVVLDSGSGQGVSNAVNQRVQGAIATLEGLGSR